MLEEILTSQGRVLRFMARHVGRSFYEQEIVQATDVSRSAVNLATRYLYQKGLLDCEQRGRMNFYTVVDRHPFVRQFKVLDTVDRLESLLCKIRPLTRRVILFGSAAEGTDTARSDIDLFIIALDRSQVLDALREYRSSHSLQAMVVDNQEFVVLQDRDTAFYAQVQRGIVLWEQIDELGA